MRTVLLLVVHFLTTLAKLVGLGGARAVVADKASLIVINQSRQRAPNLTGLDRFLFGFWLLFMNPKRLFKSNVILILAVSYYRDLRQGTFASWEKFTLA